MPSTSVPLADPPLLRSSPAPHTSSTLPRRGLSIAVAAIGLFVLVVVNAPAFLRMGLHCDPVVFDLFVRDAGRGAVLYRDMLENNTPGMIALHAIIRAGLGDSSEALRAVDLLVMGAAAGLLGWWSHRGRLDLRLFTVTLLAAFYLSTTEWCHCQRDGWMLLPVMAALYLRRAQVRRLSNGTQASVPLAVAEGVLWGLAVWIKPHVLLVAALVWLVAAAWARARGATGRSIGTDAIGVFVGGLVTGAAGVGLMAAFGVWNPYVEHLTTWIAEYSKANFYGPFGPWFFRLGFLYRNFPWSLIYLAIVPAALLVALAPIRGWLTGRSGERDERPDRPILAAALVGWMFQAFFLQHVFDYPHVGGIMLAIALLTDMVTGLPTAARRTAGLIALAGLTALGHLELFCNRAAVWTACVRGGSSELKDQLALVPWVHWVDIDWVANFLQEQNAQDGEVTVISDTAISVWKRTGLRPPVRYYFFRNNLDAYPSRRAEIIGAVSNLPHHRFLVCDLKTIRWHAPPGYDGQPPETWPLPPDWYGPRRWADRVVFRAGRYVVVAMPAADIPAWLEDVTDF